MYVYIDVIFIINMVMNSVILVLSAWAARIEYKSWRLWAAAGCGSVYVVFGCLTQNAVYHSVFVKLLLSLLTILAAFGFKNIRNFLLQVGIFYVVSFMMGGAVLGWFFFCQSGVPVYVPKNSDDIKNGISWEYLAVGASVGVLLVGMIIRRLTKRLSRYKTLYQAKIIYNGKEIDFPAMLDTGNRLYSFMGGKPVILVNRYTVEKVLDESFCRYLRDTPSNLWLSNLQYCCNEPWVSRVEIIPFRAVSGSSTLLGFRPDSFVVEIPGGVFNTRNIVIGIYSGELSHEGIYEGLLHPAVMQS